VSMPAHFTMVNDRVIKGILNPLDTGDFPYDVMPLAAHGEHAVGNGRRQAHRTPQQMVTAGVERAHERAAGPLARSS
jgi:hypothetical protein